MEIKSGSAVMDKTFSFLEELGHCADSVLMEQGWSRDIEEPTRGFVGSHVLHMDLGG